MSRKRQYPAAKEFVNNRFNPMSAKTPGQKRYFSALDAFSIVFAHGPAGTGKTAVAVSYACQELHFKRIDKIIITRPLVPACGEEVGFLPGELSDKQMPYLTPVLDIMIQVLGRSTVETYIKDGKIEGVPLAFCRGRTFNNSFVIVDEAQNTTREQMKMILTRIGADSKMFINGDPEQSDQRGINGMMDAIDKIQWMPAVKVIEFELNDIVRNHLISDIIQSYERN